MQLLPMASSPDGLISARYAVITKTPGSEVLTTTSNDLLVVRGGGGGVQIKKFIGDHFLSQNEEFTRGRTSATTTWGMLRKQPPEGGGGIRRPRLRLI